MPRLPAISKPKGLVLVRILQGTFFLAGGVTFASATALDGEWFDRHALSYYCPRSPDVFSHEAMARAIVRAVGLLLMGCGPWLAPRIARHAAEIGWASLRIGAAVLMALFVSDLGLRVATKRAHPLADANLPPMIVDEGLNMGPALSGTKDVFIGGRTIRYATDRFGNRSRSSDDAPDPSLPTILFSGESIGIGWGLPFDETVPVLVSKALGVQTVNLSVVGFATDQEYLRLERELPRYANPVAIVTFVVPIQLARNVSRNRSRLELSPAGDLRPLAPRPAFLRNSALVKLVDETLPHGDEAISLTRALLRRTAALARRRGAWPLFVFTNYSPACIADGPGPPWLARALFDGLDGSWINVEIDQAGTMSAVDLHPDAAEERKLADRVTEALRTGLPDPRARGAER